MKHHFNFVLSPDYSRRPSPRAVSLIAARPEMPVTFFVAIALASLTVWVAWFG
jgi:hypothetical protein